MKRGATPRILIDSGWKKTAESGKKQEKLEKEATWKITRLSTFTASTKTESELNKQVYIQQNNHEFKIIQNLSDTERQVSNIRQEKCHTNALKKLRKHETVNLIQLEQTVKTNTMDNEHNEHMEETI